MKRFALVLLVFFSPAVFAQAQRTFVSATNGSDSNPCTRALPCRGFAAAIANTLAGGEVVALDSGGYGPTTIPKAITLVVPAGIYGGITALTGAGLTINAADTDTVYLRGLSINGVGGADGIMVVNVGALHVESNVIRNFTNSAINFGVPRQLFVKDSFVSEVGQIGIYVEALARVEATIEHTRIEQVEFAGVFAGANSDVTVRDSVFAGNGGGAFLKWQESTSEAELNIENSALVNNVTGVACDGLFGSGGVQARVSNSTITGNDYGIVIFSGCQVRSFGNNRLAGNTTDGTFSNIISLQ